MITSDELRIIEETLIQYKEVTEGKLHLCSSFHDQELVLRGIQVSLTYIGKELVRRAKLVTKLCPRCKLPMPKDDVLNSLSHDGKTYVCSLCGQIESLDKLDPSRAEGLRVTQRRAQAAVYGLDEKRNPKLPRG